MHASKIRQTAGIQGEQPSGWYLVEGAGFDPGLQMQLVVNYTPTHGLESGPSQALPLSPVDAKGNLVSAVVLAHDVSAMRLASDDGRMPCRTGHVGLRRIGRAAAMWRMISGLRSMGSSTGHGGVWRTLLDAAATASGAGLSRAVALIVGRYYWSLRTSRPDTEVDAGVALRPGFLPISIPMQLQPLRQLQPEPGVEDRKIWEATGEDPCFRLADHGTALSLRAGWYRLRGRIQVESGSIVAPALYPDYGQGYLHEEMIRLPEPDTTGRFDALVLLKHDVDSLRFDPTIRRARFRVGRFGLARLGRVSAMLHMFAGLRTSGGGIDWRGMAAALAGFIRTAITHGFSTAATDLYAMQPAMTRQGGSYADWVRRYDTIGRLEMDVLRQRAGRLDGGPLISLLLPVYQTPEMWLRRCLDSVLQQAYQNWELCIADDASPDPRVRQVLEDYARREPRIKLELRTENGHISESSNSALALASGVYVGLLDHDDELRPHALLEVAEAIVADDGLSLLYSDEDKIDTDGKRFNPNFKPDWNPDLLLSQNYVCHFTVIRTELARTVGGFRKGFEGSQDHDLILRCTERLPDSQIRHIPKVLYHWRAIEGSTALVRDAKDYASDAGRRAVAEHLQRTGCEAETDELPHGHYRVRWKVPTPAPVVSIIIPTRDKVELLRVCVDSIRQHTNYPDYEIVIVDNQSVEAETLAYFDVLRGVGGVRILSYDAPFNYSAINNMAAAQCDGALLCLLNNDIEAFRDDWLTEMVGHASRADVGVVGAMLYYPDMTIQHAGVILGIGGVANHVFSGQPAGWPGHGARALVAQNLSAVTGACMLVRRDVYEQMGGLDETLQVAFNDIDFCLRVQRAGYRVVWTPFAQLRHHESASRGSDDIPEKRERFVQEVRFMQERWGAQLLRDPAYNPNLTLDEADFGLAFPPRHA